MNKYKYSRKEIANKHFSMSRLGEMTLKQKGELLNDLLATKPESPKEKCDHDHLCCPGGIETVRCAYCGKSMYHEPQEELEVEEIDIMELHGKDLHFALKQNELIKAHNALVKEVRKQ